MAQIFVSYSRADKQFIGQFISLIRRVYGTDNVWYDDEIHGGSDWWEMILANIADCHLFIYLVSNESLESPYCQAELQEAIRLEKQILPVIVRRLKPAYPGNINNDLAEILRKTQYVDLSGGFDDANQNSLLYGSINRLIANVPQNSIIQTQSNPTPQPPVPDKQESNTNTRVAYIAGGFAVLAAIIAGIFGLWQGVFANNDLATPTPTEIAEVVDSPTETLTIAPSQTEDPTPSPIPTDKPTTLPTDTNVPENTSIPTNTPSVAEVAQTLVAGQTAQKIVDDATATADQKTLEAQQTLTQQANETATAPVWTKTPTPDLTASVAALLTEWADGTLTQQALDSTATATLWTATPTPTLTPSNTPTLTFTLTLSPEDLAKPPVTSNDDWTPYEQEFDGVMMVLVPVGRFMMGSDNGDSDEQPVHEQEISEPFWIDKYEVSREQYQACIDASICTETSDSSYSSEPNQPINRVTWFQAKDYCEWRGGRLPTEKEWEYVARGPDNLIYPWGNEWNENNAVFFGNSNNQTAEVGSRPAGISWVGAYDMSGNVWEWVNSLYTSNYPYSNIQENASNNTNARVLRGGSFNFSMFDLRSANRYWFNPDFNFDSDGFRCARS